MAAAQVVCEGEGRASVARASEARGCAQAPVDQAATQAAQAAAQAEAATEVATRPDYGCARVDGSASPCHAARIPLATASSSAALWLASESTKQWAEHAALMRFRAAVSFCGITCSSGR